MTTNWIMQLNLSTTIDITTYDYNIRIWAHGIVASTVFEA